MGIAHKRALTPTNIISGFKTTGIYPLDDQVFSDDCFLSSAVTDRPLENRPPKELEKQRATLKDKECFQTPEQFKGYPKAQPRKTNSSGTGRQPGRSMIATDTPEKTILAQKRSRQTKGKDDAMKAKRRLLETTCSTPEGKSEKRNFLAWFVLSYIKILPQRTGYSARPASDGLMRPVATLVENTLFVTFVEFDSSNSVSHIIC